MTPSHFIYQHTWIRGWLNGWVRAPHVCRVCGYICIKIEREMRYVWNVTAQTHCIQSQSRPFGHLVSQLLGFSIDDYTHKQGESRTKMNRSSLMRLASINFEHTFKYWKWVINSFTRRKKMILFRGIENMMKVSRWNGNDVIEIGFCLCDGNE